MRINYLFTTFICLIATTAFSQNLSFHWTQTDHEPAVELFEPTDGIAQFIVPNSSTEAHRTFSLETNDGLTREYSSVDVVTNKCFTDSNCDDNLFCNGIETCINNSCVSGVAPCIFLCDEAENVCADPDPLPIEVGDEWRYFKGVSEPLVEWNELFDDQAWLIGPTGIGYGDGDDATVLDDMQGTYPSVYVRRLFHVEDVNQITSLALLIDYDDGFVAYINGVEIARSPSMEGLGNPPPFSARANTADHEAGVPEIFDVSSFIPTLEDVNVLAVQGHNHSQSSSDFSLIPSLVADLEFVCPEFLAGSQVGSVLRSDVVEASGLASSRRNQGVLWTHDDSGGDNVVFALNTSGRLLGTYRMGSGSSSDAEDMAVGSGPVPGVHYIFFGDIGDNGNSRSYIRIRRAPEPMVDPDQAFTTATLSDVDSITIQYPTGANAPSHKDTETLFVDTNGDIFIVTKRMYPNKVYRAPFPQSTSSHNVMEYVATLPTGVGMDNITGGDISADGKLIILTNDRGTDYANIWYRPFGSVGTAFSVAGCTVLLQGEPQGESIAWDAFGFLKFYTLSEAHHVSEPLWYYQKAP